ncbi:hypothetical protein ACPEIC_36080 [Stenotrophomonas sp. NPDC087984]
MRRQHGHLVVEFIGEPVDGGVLGARCSVSRGATRSGRPTEPISSEPPVKTATSRPSSASR